MKTKLNTLLVVLAAILAAPVFAAPIRTLPDLLNVTVYEITFGTTAVPFAPNAPAITTRLADPLSAVNRDFGFHPVEHYDAFYSDSAGNLDIDGSYVTIEGTLQNLGSGGMNINEVQLNFGGATPHSVFADFVGSYVYGVGAEAGSEARAVDGNLGTFPRFGYTDAGPRFRLTVGFTGISQISVPETVPTALLMALGLVGLSSLAFLATSESPKNLNFGK